MKLLIKAEKRTHYSLHNNIGISYIIKEKKFFQASQRKPCGADIKKNRNAIDNATLLDRMEVGNTRIESTARNFDFLRANHARCLLLDRFR